ncbi:hypothetical protein [Bacteroides sp. 519]|uniref:hypothetical protein n=1 Tax=Bacteroides sp. 519 TaxID=2302937 RepID=UPI0013D4CBC0|nr:hypothetical protein [Bacteroides sp. 519]NDV57876.1 hypothetical protein [Bacteroides sp. 519]
MKRLVLAIATVFCVGVSSFAVSNQPTVVKWDTNINVSKLGKYLELEASQTDEVRNITVFFTEQMSQATRAKKNQKAKIHNAVYGNLKLMKKTLTKEQYTKYLELMNTTLKNKGIILE